MPKERLFTFDFAAERLLQVTKDIKLDGKGEILALEMLGLEWKGDTALMGPMTDQYSCTPSTRHGGRVMNVAVIHSQPPVLSGHASSPAKCNLLDPSYTPHVQAVPGPRAHWKYSTWHLHYRYALP